MPDRTAFVGDTFPDVQVQVSDETGVLDLSIASSITVQFIGAHFEFSGPGAAIQPPLADPSGKYFWNLKYVLASGDTSEVDAYAIFAVVTWTTGKIETYPVDGLFVVKALPVIS